MLLPCPITLLHFPDYGLYIYASTAEIIKAALKSVKFNAVCENINIHTGDIVRIDGNGRLSVSTFEHFEPRYNYRFCNWLDWYGSNEITEEYENDLLMICGCYGVEREDVELLLEFGYTTDEVEEMLLDSDLLEQAMGEIKGLYQR